MVSCSGLAFFLYSSYWLLVKEKVKFSPYLFVYLLAFLGSIIWDYQFGYYILKFLFPFLLFLILHREELNRTSLKELFFLVVSFFPPVFVYKALSNRTPLTLAFQEKDQTSLPWKAITFGFLIGLAVMLMISFLDPEFAKFLRINEWLKYGRASLFSGLYYLIAFGWFFWTPLRVRWDVSEEKNHSLATLLQVAATIVTSIIIGYTLYDGYILLRAAKLIQLTFESLGKNTQMSYLEMVFMSGAWLFAALYLAGKMLRQNTDRITSQTRNYLIVLIATLAWLLPPLGNILRVLLVEYIPQFGLTSLRLFGLHTSVAFLVAMVATGLSLWFRSKNMFSHSVLGFALTLVLFSFLIPNNLLIYQLSLDRFHQGKEIDYPYIRGVRLHKWGNYLLEKLDTSKKSEKLLTLDLSLQTKNTPVSDKLKNEVDTYLDQELTEIKSFIEEQKFAEIKERYIPKDYWVYSGNPIPDLSIKVTEVSDQTHEDLLSIRPQRYKFYSTSLAVEYTYQNKKFSASTYVTYIPNPNREALFSLGDLTPFWALSLEGMSTNCGVASSLIDPNNKPTDHAIPEYLVMKYFNPETTCAYQKVLPVPPLPK